MKVYTIICSYIFDGDVVNIELSRMLKRLDIKPKKLRDEFGEYGVDYQVDKVIEYNVNKAYKVKYTVMPKKIKTKPDLFEYLNQKDILRFIENLNNKHSEMIIRMSKEEFEVKYKYYGNDYTKQIKGE